ncbi:hypothetical protein H4582DRAFT_2055855 [Lactarius indigo]|nr:hypothetical protein H4582DRAFT_2055855 [Lactarius indigo]
MKPAERKLAKKSGQYGQMSRDSHGFEGPDGIVLPGKRVGYAHKALLPQEARGLSRAINPILILVTNCEIAGWQLFRYGSLRTCQMVVRGDPESVWTKVWTVDTTDPVVNYTDLFRAPQQRSLFYKTQHSDDRPALVPIDAYGYFTESDTIAIMKNMAFVYLDSKLGGLLLEPLFWLQASPKFTNPYAAPDLGSLQMDWRSTTQLTSQSIIAIKAMSKVSSIVKWAPDGVEYSSTAADLSAQWKGLALTGDQHDYRRLLAAYKQTPTSLSHPSASADFCTILALIRLGLQVYDGWSSFLDNLLLTSSSNHFGMDADNPSSATSAPVSISNRESEQGSELYLETLRGAPRPAQGAMYTPLALNMAPTETESYTHVCWVFIFERSYRPGHAGHNVAIHNRTSTYRASTTGRGTGPLPVFPGGLIAPVAMCGVFPCWFVGQGACAAPFKWITFPTRGRTVIQSPFNCHHWQEYGHIFIRSSGTSIRKQFRT